MKAAQEQAAREEAEARSGPPSMEELGLNPVSLIDCEVYDAISHE